MVIKPLIRIGNSKAILLDKSILEAAGLDENALFVITINPSGGITIQSIEPNVHAKVKKKSFKKVLKKMMNCLNHFQKNKVT